MVSYQPFCMCKYTLRREILTKASSLCVYTGIVIVVNISPSSLISKVVASIISRLAINEVAFLAKKYG